MPVQYWKEPTFGAAMAGDTQYLERRRAPWTEHVVFPRMAELRVREGLYLTAGRHNAQGGLMVAMVDGRATVKYLHRDGQGWLLRPANPAYLVLWSEDSLKAPGVVAGMFRKYRRGAVAAQASGRAPLRAGTQQVRHFDGRNAHDVEQQERKTEAVEAAVELVNECLLGDSDVVGLKPAAQLLVRQPLVSPGLQQELLCVHEVNLLVCGTQRHCSGQIVGELHRCYRATLSLVLYNSLSSYLVDADLEAIF